MYLTLGLVRAAWSVGVGETHNFSMEQSLRNTREVGWFLGNIPIVCISSWIAWYLMWSTRGIPGSLIGFLMMYGSLALPLPMILLESRVPIVIKQCLDSTLPTVLHPVTEVLFVRVPSLFLSGFIPAWTLLSMFCESIFWVVCKIGSLGLLAVETAFYISTFAFLATTWAFVYRDLVHRLRMRTSSNYRADQRAREMQLTMHQFFDLDSRFGTLQTWLDTVVSQPGQRALAVMFPLAVLDFFDSASSADLARTGASYSALAEFALGSTVADMAPVFRGLGNLLKEEARAAHPNPLTHPLSHFLGTSRNLATLIMAHCLSFRTPGRASKTPTFSFRLFLPFLLTYPGSLAFEYLHWRRFLPPSGPNAFENDTSDPHRAAVREACIVMNAIAREFGLDAQQLEQLMPTYITLQRTRRNAVALENVAFRTILDAVLDWKNRKNELEMRRFKQD